MTALLALALAAVPCVNPHWARYAQTFISPDGRVIDRTGGERTTSEGQAYGLFFALVENDRALFERLLDWTAKNLAEGELAAKLPSWNWGKRKDGSWGVLDRNAASDADLWLAYDLVEAGRLWHEPRFTALGRRVLANVAAREIVILGGLGPMLLPGPVGFAVEGGKAFRLNPSYEPPQLLRRFAALDPSGPWAKILDSTAAMLRATASRGAVADWVLYRPRKGFAQDPVNGAVGSYDAIRSYLWIGMLREDDPLRRELAQSSGALLSALAKTGDVPEKIDVRSLHGKGVAPVGFSAALLPLALARQDHGAVAALGRRISASARGDVYGDPPTYYDQNLVLFGRGFAEGRFRFGADGSLEPAWEAGCTR